jgi:hypothetical protein
MFGVIEPNAHDLADAPHARPDPDWLCCRFREPSGTCARSASARRTYKVQHRRVDLPEPVERRRRERVAGDVVDDAYEAPNLASSVQHAGLLFPGRSKAKKFHCREPRRYKMEWSRRSSTGRLVTESNI